MRLSLVDSTCCLQQPSEIVEARRKFWMTFSKRVFDDIKRSKNEWLCFGETVIFQEHSDKAVKVDSDSRVVLPIPLFNNLNPSTDQRFGLG